MVAVLIPTHGTALICLLVMPLVWSGAITTGVGEIYTVCVAEELPLSPIVSLITNLGRRSSVTGRIRIGVLPEYRSDEAYHVRLAHRG